MGSIPNKLEPQRGGTGCVPSSNRRIQRGTGEVSRLRTAKLITPFENLAYIPTMRRFIDLLTEQSKVPAEERPEWVTSQTKELLSRSSLNAWHVGDPIPVVDHWVLIGIAAWSGYDLRLLDVLAQARAKPGAQERIAVFDIDVEGNASRGYDYLERIIPGLGKIYQTPVVGVWESGILKQCGSGFAGRNLIVDRYNLNGDEMIAEKG